MQTKFPGFIFVLLFILSFHLFLSFFFMSYVWHTLCGLCHVALFSLFMHGTELIVLYYVVRR